MFEICYLRHIFFTNLSDVEARYDTYDCFVFSLRPTETFLAPTFDGFSFWIAA